MEFQGHDYIFSEESNAFFLIKCSKEQLHIIDSNLENWLEKSDFGNFKVLNVNFYEQERVRNQIVCRAILRDN